MPQKSVFVGIHVRRGDLLGKEAVSRGQLVPTIRYFEKAMTFFLSKYSNYSTVQFIVCSDDIQWCKSSLKSVRLAADSKFDESMVSVVNVSSAANPDEKQESGVNSAVDYGNQDSQLASPAYGIHFSPGLSPEFDLALLAQCNHSIMTLGTFGWWGAWLAGGDVIYFNHSMKEGSRIGKVWINEDFFWPTWIGMDDK